MLKYQITKAKRKICFKGLFKFIILFFYIDLTAKNQPETTRNPDKQIPGTNPVNEITLYLEEHFQIRACLKHEMAK